MQPGQRLTSDRRGSVDLAQLGRAAVGLLLSRVADPALPARREVHPVRLTPRATHGPPRRDDGAALSGG